MVGFSLELGLLRSVSIVYHVESICLLLSSSLSCRLPLKEKRYLFAIKSTLTTHAMQMDRGKDLWGGDDDEEEVGKGNGC